MGSDSRVPVTLLTGFLGSGKTTIVNTLLQYPALGATVVIVNEFGEIGLDHELVLSSSEDIVLLQSGCLCCSLRGDLLELLLELNERRAAGEFSYERIVIETSGLADPAPILHTFLTHSVLADAFVMDGVVVTVDTVVGAETLAQHEEAKRQVAMGDLLLLTKTDLPEANEAATQDAIASLNPGAPIRTVKAGQVNPRDLIGLYHFSRAMSATQVGAWMRVDSVPPPSNTDADAWHHLNAIRSVSWCVDAPLIAELFDAWMGQFMAQHGQDLLRFKGLIHVKDAQLPYAVHGVQHIFHPPVALKAWQGEDRRSKLVVIVRDFTDPELEEIFAGLDAQAPSLPLSHGGYLSAEVRA